MGNNQLMLLQFPRTFYFFNIAWDTSYQQHREEDVMLDLAEQLYPEQRKLIAEAFLSLNQTDSDEIQSVVARLHAMLQHGTSGRPGVLGRLLFPDAQAVARNLEMQLEIRGARQALLKAMLGKPTLEESSRLVEDYFDKLLAWNRETGWDKMIDITIWPRAIYEGGKDMTETVYRLKQILADGAPYTSYAKINAFFGPIEKSLRQRYSEDSVMVGCIEPFKLSVVQSQ